MTANKEPVLQCLLQCQPDSQSVLCAAVFLSGPVSRCDLRTVSDASHCQGYTRQLLFLLTWHMALTHLLQLLQVDHAF